MAQFPPSRFEHFGINVRDIDRMARFYCDNFGFTISDRGQRFNGTNIVFLTKSATDHHQFVLIDGLPEDSGPHNLNQISFAFEDLDALRTVYRKLIDIGVQTDEIMQVNHGNAWSLYTKDPEGNPLELFVDSTWHTPQPCKGDLDIEKSTETILRETEELCKSRPEFATREEWSKGMMRKLEGQS